MEISTLRYIPDDFFTGSFTGVVVVEDMFDGVLLNFLIA